MIDWKLKAKCVKDGVHPDFFYPTAPSGRKPEGTIDDIEAERARYCYGLDDGKLCPVRTDCLDYAIETRQDHGVWGGHTESERLRIRKRRRNTKTA